MEARPRTRGGGRPWQTRALCAPRPWHGEGGPRTLRPPARRSCPTAAPANPRFALNGRGLGTMLAAAAAGPEVTSSTGRPFGALDRVSLGV